MCQALKIGKLFPMVKFMMAEGIYVRDTGEMGRGVFTSKPIRANTIIERSPVIVLNKKDRVEVEKTVLNNYIFEWGPRGTQCCVALGYISVYNHSFSSNCEYEMYFDVNIIAVKTMRTIKAGEELFINYNGTFNDQKKLWFDAR
jgi:SET domain-containing protein